MIAFEDLFPVVKEFTTFLYKIISWPRIVGSAMLSGSTVFPTPFGSEEGLLH